MPRFYPPNQQGQERRVKGFDNGLSRVFRFGRRWRIIYSLPGDDADTDTVQNTRRRRAKTPSKRSTTEKITGEIFVYWLFGGSRLKRTPWLRFMIKWNRFKTRVRNLFGGSRDYDGVVPIANNS
ncbi:hypothetical protein QBC35DRAFT_508787 [Podospora australis]|uniref:Uncharacterized protein n=1 Tax=Podospora australis TaxID=1536484 RepID=A0AAN6WJ77_9PEZI|nr:hypothetical protein QBC35DRAFT_508787 [Podospora australis]